MNIDKIPPQMLRDLREADYTIAELCIMSKRELFDTWCGWHGLINWSGSLYDMVLSLEASDA
jgi:hypothetical protein